MSEFAVTLDGLNLRAKWVSPPRDGLAPLVLLHEGLGSIALWRGFPDALAAATGLPLFVYERAGHGASDPARGPRGLDYLAREAEAMFGVLDAVGVDRCIPVGHSDGGSIALLAAAMAPDRILAGITEAAHVFVEDVTIAGIVAAREAYPKGLRDRLTRHHGANTDALFDAWSLTWLSPPFRAWSIEDQLPKITAPFLVIQGEDDEYGSPAQVAAIAAGVSGPAEPLLVPNCAHVPHLQAAQPVLDAMAEFVKRAAASF